MSEHAPAGLGWDAHVHVFDADAPARPGHYRPVTRTLAEIEAAAAAQGIGHLVLVQPSVYGHDHQVLLRALAAGGGRHRGVAVLAPDVSEAELDRLQAAGVCGVRFNRVSPAGHRGTPGDAAADLQSLAPRLRARGWHVQWYVAAHELPLLAELQRKCALTFVLDHLAGLHPGLALDDPAWAAAAALAQGGAWLKLSGWYRLQAPAPYDTLVPVIRRAAALFGERCVFGSDWPHTSFGPDALPSYASMLRPVRTALGSAAIARVLQRGPVALYQGPAGHGAAL